MTANGHVPRISTRSREAFSPDATPIDAVLVARIRGGDAPAFETLFHRYHDALYRFAYGFLRRRDLVDDVLQEVFFRVWERRAEWAIVGTAQAYLYTAVRNRAIRVLRHGRVVAAHADAYAFEEDNRRDAPDHAAESADLEAALDRALGTLAHRTREVFVLHRRHNLSYAEIASVTQMTVKGVEYHMAVALRTLRAQLNPLLRDA